MTYAIVAGVLALVALGFWWLIKSRIGVAKKEGATEVAVETQKTTLENVKKAKDAEEAVASGSDDEWLKRVRAGGRRK